jgi:hypothetical protein
MITATRIVVPPFCTRSPSLTKAGSPSVAAVLGAIVPIEEIRRETWMDVGIYQSL